MPRMDAQNELRKLPGIDKLISDKQIAELRQEFRHEVIVDVARSYLEELRTKVTNGSPISSYNDIVDTIAKHIKSLGIVGPKPLLNATGVILHTNLGRAPLSDEALSAMKTASEGYSNLEFDLSSGKRGTRHAHLEQLLCLLSGAEDAMVVNNNASGVLLALSALTKRKEVIVSRGQAVQIGGGFRIPDVMKQSGAKLVEVGTTNFSYTSDYEQAITERTAALLRVHSSNFRVVGFTEEATIEDMVQVGNRHEIPVLDDLGSGCFLNTAEFGLNPEPRVQDSISANVGLALFSGDKLLGGPQAGIIVGKTQLINKLKKHPLARAVRTDKISLAALSATLIHYVKGEAAEKIPIWQMISMPANEIKIRAEKWARQIGSLAAVSDGESTVGGGSLPGSVLPTHLVTLKMPSKTKVQDIANDLRIQPVPLVGRIEKNSLVLDPRCVHPKHDELLLQTISNVLS